MPGDVVELVFPMSVHQINANQLVEADAGRIALQRGPLVYCLEGKDQPDERVLNLLVSTDQEIGTQFEPELLGGVQTLSLEGGLVERKTSPMDAELKSMRLKAIPYYAWANRGKDYMIVWLPIEVRQARAVE
ncbi:MAG: glycoside hydrolase family 127 protein [Lewinellaceae bacterium]|nr:glycoside hydrolase family 127 protein [Lewinellaceae bacterium]